jgi:hypothetical protein
MKCLRSRRTIIQKVFLLLLIMICLMYLRIGMAAAEESCHCAAVKSSRILHFRRSHAWPFAMALRRLISLPYAMISFAVSRALQDVL